MRGHDQRHAAPVCAGTHHDTRTRAVRNHRNLVLGAVADECGDVLLVARVHHQVRDSCHLAVPQSQILVEGLAVAVLDAAEVVVGNVLCADDRLDGGAVFRCDGGRRLEVDRLVALTHWAHEVRVGHAELVLEHL